MMTNIRRFLRYLRKLKEVIGVLNNSFGWRRSFLDGRAVDARGMPLPWYTYPAIEYFSTLDLRGLVVFEYGCGQSSMFWGTLAAQVMAVEHNSRWAELVRGMKIPNLTLIEAAVPEQYAQAPLSHNKKFDVVVIDGWRRHACVDIACEVVSETGFIVLDNSDWYPRICDQLQARGWSQIDFSGFGPINPYCWTTSMFIRPQTRLARVRNPSPRGGISAEAEADE